MFSQFVSIAFAVILVTILCVLMSKSAVFVVAGGAVLWALFHVAAGLSRKSR